MNVLQNIWTDLLTLILKAITFVCFSPSAVGIWSTRLHWRWSAESAEQTRNNLFWHQHPGLIPPLLVIAAYCPDTDPASLLDKIYSIFTSN